MRLLWSEVAWADLNNIHAYIARDVPYYAEIFVDRLVDATSKLQYHPYIGRMVPELGYREDVRELIVHGYRIVYLVNVDTVQILTIVHGSRNLEWQRIL